MCWICSDGLARNTGGFGDPVEDENGRCLVDYNSTALIYHEEEAISNGDRHRLYSHYQAAKTVCRRIGRMSWRMFSHLKYCWLEYGLGNHSVRESGASTDISQSTPALR
jgi:hypothetical protein